MNTLEGVLSEIKAEVKRCSQRLDGLDVLPDRIRVAMPMREFGKWAPVLPEVTGELGEALVEWAVRRGSAWYGDGGPTLDAVLSNISGIHVSAEFSGDTSRDTVMVPPSEHQTGRE